MVKVMAFPGSKSTTCVVFTRPSLPEAVTVYVPGAALISTDDCYITNNNKMFIHISLIH